MPAQKKQPSLALIFALFLTFSVIVIKGSALQWASLAWVSLCALGFSVLVLQRVIGQQKQVNIDTRSNHSVSFKIKDVFNLLLPVTLFITFQLWALVQYATLSPDKSASLDQSLIGLGMLFLLATWSLAVRHSKALDLLFALIVLSSITQCVYGLWVYLSGADLILWMPKRYYLDRPTGFFVNANHFAAYLLLGIILCFSKIMSNSKQVIKKNILIRTFDQLYNPINAVLCLLILTLIASKSIGGIVSLVSVLFLIGVHLLWSSENRKTLLVSAIAIFFMLCVLFLSLDYSIVETEISGLAHTFFRRIEISKAAFSMLENNWLTGIGGGSFYSQFSPYRTLEVGNAYYNYAHNDLLQLWIEYGLIGITILLMFVGVAIRDNLRVLSRTTCGIGATFAYASIYSTIAVGVHSLVDFPLHIPGFSVCYLVIISINSLVLISQSHFRKQDSGKST